MPEVQTQGPIKTIAKLCRKCYACVRTCPTKAIGIRNDCAVVLHQRCIGCGKCIQACSQGAKVIADAIGATEALLRETTPVVAVLGCSYPAFFFDLEPGQLATALRQLGFVDVLEGAAGVELIAPEYRALLSRDNSEPLISSHCPAVVDLIERHYPQLIKNLVSVVSPMVAIGRYIKSCHNSPVRVVYISSCIGGKFEIEDKQVAGAIDKVLTYKELKKILEKKNIDPRRLKAEPFNGNSTLNGRSFSIAGGPFHIFGIGHDGLDPQYVSTVGEEATMEVIRDIAARRIAPRYVDVRFCTGGCIGGPGRTNRLTAFSKRNLIIEYHKKQIPYLQTPQYSSGTGRVSLNRGFADRQLQMGKPSGDAITRILHETDKFTTSDELNCGSCGYRTCREHAVAVFQGLAESGMCHPYSQKRLAEDHSKLERKYDLARRALDQSYANDNIVGNDGRTQGVLKLIQQVGPTPTSVLIRGESGTGKELTARAIHQASQRSENPLVTINCTTLTDSLLESELFGHKKGAFTGAIADKKGLFEAADGGTIFLDEIGDITPKLQAELLRVLDNGEIKPVGNNTSVRVDVRLIAATNKHLEEGISNGWFREDLFYRINVFSITLPPLRDRLEALPKLVEHFLNQASTRLNKTIHRIDDSALNALACYHWPGNIRELQNVIERAAVLSPDQIIHLEQLPRVFAEQLRIKNGENVMQQACGLRNQRDQQLNMVEKNLLLHYLAEADGNVSAAARLAEIPRRTFYRMLERQNINQNRQRHAHA